MDPNDDLFLTKNTYKPKGTLEDRWGPAGYLVCTGCYKRWLCHFNAWFEYRKQNKCTICKARLEWEPKL